MKASDDFIKLMLWVLGLTLLGILIRYWISSQNYNLYSMTAGLIFFTIVSYISYTEVKS